MRRACLALAMSVAAACGQTATDTCGFANDELSIVAVVVDRGNVVRAEIDFEAGDRTLATTPLSVCEDETLRINDSSPTQTDKPERIVYSANLEADARTVTFSLSRPDDDTVTVSIDLPEAFEVTAPTAGEMLSRGSDTVLTWEPPSPADQMRIELGEDIGGGICIFTDEGEHHYKDLGGVEVPDEGQWTVPAGSVHSDPGGPCNATYTLQRIVQGQYPASLQKGGFVEARVERMVTFVSVD